MARPRLGIRQHLTAEEVKKRYLTCDNAIEKTHWQVIWLMTKENPLLIERVSEVIGFCEDWIRRLIRRYNEEGPEGLEDKRQKNGKDLILTKELISELDETLEKIPPDGGLWTGPKVASWISNQLNHRKVSAVTGWQYLKRLGFSIQSPRTQNLKAATKEEQKIFKKN